MKPLGANNITLLIIPPIIIPPGVKKNPTPLIIKCSFTYRCTTYPRERHNPNSPAADVHDTRLSASPQAVNVRVSKCTRESTVLWVQADGPMSGPRPPSFVCARSGASCQHIGNSNTMAGKQCNWQSRHGKRANAVVVT